MIEGGGGQGCWQGRRLAVIGCVLQMACSYWCRPVWGGGGRGGLPKCVLERLEEIPDNSRFLKISICSCPMCLHSEYTFRILKFFNEKSYRKDDFLPV